MRVDGAVVRCPAPVKDLPDAPDSGVLWRAAPGRLLLDIPDVARYLVSDGNLVEINPCGGVEAGEADPHGIPSATIPASMSCWPS